MGFAEFNRSTCAEIAAADTDDHEDLGVAADFLRRKFDAGKFFFVVVFGKVNPAEEVVPRAGFFGQRFVGSADFAVNRLVIRVGNKVFQIVRIQFQ